MAAQNDWDIWHNEEHVSNGGYCHILTANGVNQIEGTFEWLSGGNPGIDFEYTYDRSIFYDAPATWSSPYYEFDFWTDWPHDYGGLFEIVPDNPFAATYHCDTWPT